MKKHFYLLLLISNIGFSQISIDSFVVYNTGNILDSFYMKTTSQGQVFHSITLPSTVDICATIYGAAYFKGCETGQITHFDTVIVYGFPSSKMGLSIYWDTSFTCPLPLEITPMDFKIWNQCDNWGIQEEYLQSRISIYPNPSKGAVHIQNSSEIEILDIWLLDQLGRSIKQFGKHEEVFDLTDVKKGIYLLSIRTNRGEITKRIERL